MQTIMYENCLLSSYFPPRYVAERSVDEQVTPCELATIGIHSRQLHLKALINSFDQVYDGLVWTKHLLVLYSFPFNDDMKPTHHDEFAKYLTTSVILLEGLLDGLMILDKGRPSRNVTFQNSRFKTSPVLLLIQQQMLELKSVGEGSEIYTDFWSIANFWKHYFPYMMLPTSKDARLIHDVYVPLSEVITSGPLMYDIFVPMYNCTRALLLEMCKHLKVNEPIADELTW